MALSTTASRVQYLGDGSTTDFTVTFEFFADIDLKVYSTVIATGVTTLLVLNTHYTLVGAGVGVGGTLTMLVAPASTVRLTIARVVTLIQSSVYNEDADFPVKVVEGDFDYSMMTLQQQADALSRSIQIPISDPTGTIINIPNSVERANKVLSFDGAGNVAATVDGGYYRGTWITATQYFFRDLFTDPITSDLYFTQITHVSTSIAADTASGYIVKILDTVSITGPQGDPGTPGSSFAGATTGSANAYNATFVGYTYTNGAAVTIVPNFTNDPLIAWSGSGAFPSAVPATLNVNSLGDIPIYGIGGVALQEGGALVSGVPITLRYYNSKFYIEPVSSSPKLLIYSVYGAIGNPLGVDGSNNIKFQSAGPTPKYVGNNYSCYDGITFTVPRDGKYEISGQVSIQATSVHYVGVQLAFTSSNFNSNTELLTIYNPSSSIPVCKTYSLTYNFSAGDTVTLKLYDHTAAGFIASQNSPLFLYLPYFQIKEL